MIELNKLPLYPYPKDGPTRFGFIVGDILVAGIFLLFAIAIFPTLIR